jgi:hypothetical protein
MATFISVRRRECTHLAHNGLQAVGEFRLRVPRAPHGDRIECFSGVKTSIGLGACQL